MKFGKSQKYSKKRSLFAFPNVKLLTSNVLSTLFATLFYLLGIRRRIVRRNLELTGIRPPCFLRWKLAYNLFSDAFSLFFGPSLPKRGILRVKLSVHSQAHLNALRGASRAPSILLAAHFHNWEAQAAVLGALGVPLLGAARALSNPWADRMLRAVRARHGIPVVTDDSAAVPRRALRHLRAGGCFGFLWDQHSPASTDPGTFFGHPVSLNPLPFALLQHQPAPVYFGIWLPGGELRILQLMAVPFPADWRPRLERRYHRVLQTLVRRHPTYWYGFLHARFKTLGPYPGHREHRDVGR